MPYAILRFQKRKAGGVAACERHNERKKEAYKSNPDIDMERSKNNYHLVKPPRYTYKKEINRMVAEAGCRTRKDSVMMVETLITASPEFMKQLPPEEQKEYFSMALDFISERVGEQNILSAVVHMDERTPHMHLCFVPITPDNKLSAKTILGNQKSLSEWQTAYHERMSSRWNQLERGQSSMETKRKHVPTWLYKLGGRLDKQYGEIVSALSDINAFNAGKKRDKALELVAAWLPEVEKFSKEIGRQQAYIDSLKEQIGQEADYAGRMRDEKYEQELKVQKANQKIFELQRTNGISLREVNLRWKPSGNTSPHGSISWAAGLISSMGKSCLPCPTSTPLTQGKSVTRLWNWLPHGCPKWRNSLRKSADSRRISTA